MSKSKCVHVCVSLCVYTRVPVWVDVVFICVSDPNENQLNQLFRKRDTHTHERRKLTSLAVSGASCTSSLVLPLTSHTLPLPHPWTFLSSTQITALNSVCVCVCVVLWCVVLQCMGMAGGGGGCMCVCDCMCRHTFMHVCIYTNALIHIHGLLSVCMHDSNCLTSARMKYKVFNYVRQQITAGHLQITHVF